MSSFLWVSLYYLLICEIITILILLSPFKFMRKISCNIINHITNNFYVKIMLLMMCCLIFVLFVDASVEIVNFISHSDLSDNNHLNYQKQIRHFRAQRNIYITGFTMLLSVIIYRICGIFKNYEAALNASNYDTPNNGAQNSAHNSAHNNSHNIANNIAKNIVPNAIQNNANKIKNN